MRVIGTAGHVDHGKSTLVEALTGTHPDRLKEEREREMTIELGFAWFTLPNGEEVGIVDVPGHRDFIENMLAGVGGIDAALFVVAADEGVMPQTREHLAILDLLQIPSGVVALTKADLVETDWMDLVEDELRQELAGTVLEGAPIVRVSARTHQGLPELVQSLDAMLADKPPRPDLGRPRLPIDRVFTIAGFGTVVTGTLVDGRLQLGDDVEILPQHVRGRVRGLQSHKQKEETAVPGSRTAVNIAGVDIDQVSRGQVLAHPGDYRPTRRLDARFRLLSGASQPLEHNTEVKLFLGASEVVARLRLLGVDMLAQGSEGWVQLELNEPVVTVRGDRYILRRPSPGETLGGGQIIDPQPKGRHKRFSQETLAGLEAISRGSPAEILMQALQAVGTGPLQEVINRSNLGEAEAQDAAKELFETGQMIALESGPAGLVTSQGSWSRLADQGVREVEGFHRAYPLRPGMPKEELKSRLNLPARQFTAAFRKLANNGLLEEAGPLVRKPGYTIQFSPQQQRAVQNLLERFAAAPYAPPSVKEAAAEVGEELYNALVDTGKLQAISSEVVFRREDYQRMVAEVREMLQQQGTVTASQVRDHFHTSRKYALALLEHLDAQGVTLREGDVRRLKK